MSSEETVDKWLSERPEILNRYPNHWLLINLRRQGVSLSGTNEKEFLAHVRKEITRCLDKGQDSSEVLVIHTSRYSIKKD